MPVAYKVLGQSAPAATTDTTVYTVPASTEAVISTVVVTNRSATARTFRIAIRPNGAALANQHYVVYDSTVNANDIVALSLGLTADATDVITVYASSGDLSFGVFGSEITA